MGDYERKLRDIIYNNFTYQELEQFLTYPLFNEDNRDTIYKQEIFVNYLPVLIQHTDENNFQWLHSMSDYVKINGFIDVFLQNIYLFSLNSISFLNIIVFLKQIPFQDKDVCLFIETVLHYHMQVDWDDIYYLIRDVRPNMIPWMLERLIQDKTYCGKAIHLFVKESDNIYLPLLYQNIDTIILNTDNEDLFYLRNIVKYCPKVYDMVIHKIRTHTKKHIIKLLKALYLRVVVTHSYYHDLSYIEQKHFNDILEIIYLIIEDVCRNEEVDISSIENIGSGAYSSVLLVGNKVIKIGLQRATSRFPNNPYINAILLRREFPITNKESFFVEVNEKVDNESDISDEELYELYKKLRDIQLIWLDVDQRNAGRLLRDNKIYWKCELPITDEILGLDPYRGNDLLKKGDIVVLDNDLIYDEKSCYLTYQSSTSLQKEFEKRYQKEKILHKKVEN